MLASACPGWVCYAEKAHGDLVLPHIAAAKSPQVCVYVCVCKCACVRVYVCVRACVCVRVCKCE
jgi:iron only hydrogenase large subunit-like protein